LREYGRVPAAAVQKRTAPADGIPLAPFFTARPVWDVDPAGGLVYSNGSEYSVLRFTSAGAPALEIRAVGVESRAVTQRDVEAQRASMADLYPKGANRPVRSDSAAARHPAITDLRCLRDSTFLLRRVPAEARDSVRWDLWEISGRLLGQLQLDVRDHVVDGDRGRILVAFYSAEVPGRIAWIATGLATR
jgi:hypothetical protein